MECTGSPRGSPRPRSSTRRCSAPRWPGRAGRAWLCSPGGSSPRDSRAAPAGSPGTAPELQAASLRRRRQVVAPGATGLAVALGLAASTAVFTATYDPQAALDVALTVGADVSVTAPPSVALPPGTKRTLAAAPGARAVEAVQHRFAYVGPDLQDVCGIDPATIGAPPRCSTPSRGSTIQQALSRLAATPDGVLLSAETLHD